MFWQLYKTRQLALLEAIAWLIIARGTVVSWFRAFSMPLVILSAAVLVLCSAVLDPK
jgi:hypothetical protein